MDVIELLTQDHERVLALFEQFDNLKEQPEQNRGKLEKLFSKIKFELEQHTFAEEQYFYPELENDEETRDLIAKSLKEHQNIKSMLAELDNEKVNHQWIARLSDMGEKVMHHIGEEENDLFEKTVEILDEDEINKIGDSIQQLKKAA